MCYLGEKITEDIAFRMTKNDTMDICHIKREDFCPSSASRVCSTHGDQRDPWRNFYGMLQNTYCISVRPPFLQPPQLDPLGQAIELKIIEFLTYKLLENHLCHHITNSQLRHFWNEVPYMRVAEGTYSTKSETLPWPA